MQITTFLSVKVEKENLASRERFILTDFEQKSIN